MGFLSTFIPAGIGRLPKCAAFLAATLYSLATAQADLVATLTQPTQNVAAGGWLVFNGALSNTSNSTQLYLNDLQLTGQNPALLLQSNTYYSSVPGILLPGETYTGPLFSLRLNAGASSADYPGTVIFLGGADIFATDALASVNFLALSPMVNLTATAPEASEYGSVAGHFTLTRSGSLGIDLPVGFAITGTAVNGASYLAIPTSIAIPAGSATAAVTITPITNNIADGDRTAILTLAPSGDFNLGTNVSDTVTVHDLPADAWRFAEFGAASNSPEASDTASWAQDGVPNLVKYALGLDPTIPIADAQPAPTMTDGFLTISFAPAAQAIDVGWSVEASTDLQNWSPNNVAQWPLTNPQPPNLLSFYYTIPPAAAGQAFLRAHFTRRTHP